MKNSRRDFLKKALIGSAGLISPRVLAGDLVNPNVVNPKVETCEVIVIGAGMAGLIAARDLTFPDSTSNGFRTIVLEGSNRIGGRILTSGFGDSAESIAERAKFGGPIELGAEYIHREKGSVDLWKDIELYKTNIEEIPRFDQGLIYYDGWEDNLRTEFRAGVEWLSSEFSFLEPWKIWKKSHFFDQIDAYKGPNISAKDWLDSQGFNNLGRNLVDLFFTGHIPGHLDKISLKGFGSDRISEQELEEVEYGFPNGYAAFLDQLVKRRDANYSKPIYIKDRFSKNYMQQRNDIDIRKGTKVNYIAYGPNGVEVRTSDGKIFQAKAAIITASVGMLKSGEIEFNPPLPRDKKDALHVMGMGDEAKMALKFKKRFWPEDAVILNRIDNNREMARTYFIPFSMHPEINKTLVVLWAGAEADKVSQMTDMEIIEALCRDIDKMFPAAAKEAGGSVYKLLEMREDGTPVRISYQWSLDALSKGSDSYLIAGAERTVPVTSARSVLASPLTTPGLFWAGEATAFGKRTQPCSTHGAHFTGVRAASEVKEYLNNKNIKY
jgi:monoamine oxidase